MKRWENYKCVNTPGYHDQLWADELAAKRGNFDHLRLEALCKEIKSQDSVCELGGGMYGAAQWFLTFKTNIDVYMYILDHSPWVIDWLSKQLQGKPRLELYCGKAEESPYDDDSFDVVIAGEVLEHFEDPESLVLEMTRISKDGGLIAMSTVDMHCPDAIRNKVKYEDHVWDFTPADLIDLFTPVGDPHYYRCGNYHMIDCIVQK